MKKILTLFCCMGLVLTLTACDDEYYDKNEKISKYCDLVVIEDDGVSDYEILYDKNTKVMYCLYNNTNHSNGITPIYNADGTLKLYEEE